MAGVDRFVAVMVLWLVLLQSGIIAPPTKVDGRVLAADHCHYIIQGAKLSQLSSLNQQGRCLSWEGFTTYENHLAALQLYRDEVEVAWPGNMKKWDLVRDLKLVDAKIAADKSDNDKR